MNKEDLYDQLDKIGNCIGTLKSLKELIVFVDNAKPRDEKMNYLVECLSCEVENLNNCFDESWDNIFHGVTETEVNVA